MDSPLSDRELIELARAGDSASLGTLFERYSDYLLGVITKLMGMALRRTLEPADVLQETLLTATARFHDFTGNDDRELHMWLSTLARRKLVDLARHNGRLKRALKKERSLSGEDSMGRLVANLLPGDSITASRIAAGREMNSQLCEALSRMDPREAEALWLRYVDMLTLEQIGEQMGTGRNGARGLVARALASLRGQLPPE